MSETTNVLNAILNEKLESCILSNPREKEMKKCSLRPLEIKGRLAFQESLYKGKQVFHKNLTKQEAVRRVDKYLEVFGQLEAVGEGQSLLILVSKKGKRTIKVNKRIVPGRIPDLSHNRGKRYILEEGSPVDFLVDLGVMTKEGQVDMVVTLHACDTATDYALYKAVKWHARVILSVPCCQHELNRTIKNDDMRAVFQFGLLKERMAALATDGMRAELLRTKGYDMQVLEFIDMEHTPKNILLRGIYTGKETSVKDYQACKRLLGGGIMLEKLFETQ